MRASRRGPREQSCPDRSVQWGTPSGAAVDQPDVVSIATAAPGTPALTITTAVTFKWLTPLGALPGLSSPGLTGTKVVDASTTMRCE